MNAASFCTLLSLPLIALALTACGGSSPAIDSAPVQTAAVVRVVDLSVDPSAARKNPAPDCAPEGCKGLRIIDGNAEAFRIDAMRRAGQDS
jgi:hypothetical protein